MVESGGLENRWPFGARGFESHPLRHRAERRDHDIPLTLEHSFSVGTGKLDTALTSSSCRAPFDLEVSHRTVDTVLVCEAGAVLRAGNAFVVVSPGELTFRAGRGIELESGFDVEGGSFTAEIDPALEP